jgi:hypothetical protein
MRSRVAAAVLFPLLLIPATAFDFTFSRTLCLGDAGTAVASLPQFLNDDRRRQPHGHELFGALTRAAVMHFQTAQGLTAIGCTGSAHQRDRGAASRVDGDAIEQQATRTSPGRRGTHRPNSSACPPAPTAQCPDGTHSFSLHHSGTCSHHGGVSARAAVTLKGLRRPHNRNGSATSSCCVRAVVTSAPRSILRPGQ